MESIKEYYRIKSLDLSWNSLGTNKGMVFANAMVELFPTENLVHLDISHNQLSYEACQKISDELADNHSIWGLHCRGNCAEIDVKGFMKVYNATEQRNVAAEQLSVRNNKGTRFTQYIYIYI